MVGLPAWALGQCQDALKRKDAICGSGSVQGMSNLGLARSDAEGRARTELARSLEVRVKSMLKDYQAATQGGRDQDTSSEQHIEEVSKQITDITLSGSGLEDTFVSETGTFWALVVLDTGAFKDSLKNMKTLDERLRTSIVKRADRAFREANRRRLARGARRPRAKSADRGLAENHRPLWRNGAPFGRVGADGIAHARPPERVD